MSNQPALAPSDSRASLQGTAAGKRRGVRWVAWLLGLTVFLFIACILGVIYWATAYVTGHELNATTWQVRRFTFLRDPFTETQLTLVRHDNSTGFVLDPSVAGYIVGGPIAPAGTRWDLIDITGGARSGEGEAAILLKYLEVRGPTYDEIWGAWTLDHPKAAALLWRAIRDTVHLPRYDRLPELFDAARMHTDVEELKRALDKIMVAIALQEAERQTVAGDLPAARRAAVMGLTYGDSAKLQSLVDSPASTEPANDTVDASR